MISCMCMSVGPKDGQGSRKEPVAHMQMDPYSGI